MLNKEIWLIIVQGLFLQLADSRTLWLNDKVHVTGLCKEGQWWENVRYKWMLAFGEFKKGLGWREGTAIRDKRKQEGCWEENISHFKLVPS